VAIDVDPILTKPLSMVVGLQRAASKRGIIDFEVLLWAQEGGEEEGMERERERRKHVNWWMHDGERERTCPTPTVNWEGKECLLFLRLRWDFGGMQNRS
jgi:hypothetical protein